MEESSVNNYIYIFSATRLNYVPRSADIIKRYVLSRAAGPPQPTASGPPIRDLGTKQTGIEGQELLVGKLPRECDRINSA